MNIVSFKNNQNPRGRFFVWLTTKAYCHMRLILFSLGFTKFSKVSLKINDVFTDYCPIQDCTIASIVVSNHVSFADMFFYLWYPVSFLSKEAVAHTIVIGWNAITRQSIFLNRAEQKDREKVLELIRERADRVRDYNDIHPLLIFPEGTCSNGRTLMNFKKGAFFSGHPIKIFVIKYNNEFQVISSIGNANAALALLMTMLQPWNNITLYEYSDHFDPQYSLRKRGITLDDPEAWQHVANDVKELMKFISGFETTEEGFRELIEFEKESLTVRNPSELIDV